MNKDKFFYNQICIDYTPFDLIEKVTVKDIMKWSDFLHKINFNNMNDVYSYLNEKINEL
jgi:hypothetical protein